MSKQIYLHIQEPCHENWEAMSSVEQGRFCQSCAKQVVDFSRMSDSQIMDVLSKAAGNTCGRFTGNQLERPLVKDSIEIPFFLKPYKLILSSLVPLVIISTNASAQIQKGEITSQERQVMGKPISVGTLSMTVLDEPLIEGRVLDEFGKPLKAATIQIKGTKMKTVSGATGNFTMRLKNGQQKTTLLVSNAGYITKEIVAKTNQAAPIKVKLVRNDVVVIKEILPTVNLAKDDNLEIREIKPQEVTVRCVATEELVGIVGGLSIVKTVSVRDTLKTAFQKLFKNELFQAFPNPISKGQTLHLRFKQEGDYSLQLFDNSGRLYTEKQLKMIGKGHDFLLAMPATLGSGTYYLKAISSSTKKQYIEKIVVP